RRIGPGGPAQADADVLERLAAVGGALEADRGRLGVDRLRVFGIDADHAAVRVQDWIPAELATERDGAVTFGAAIGHVRIGRVERGAVELDRVEAAVEVAPLDLALL